MTPLELDIRHEAGVFRLRAALSIGQGATVVFGPSGAGKSLLLSAVAGAYRPAEGRISIDGAVVFDRARGIFVPPERRGVGWVSQAANLFPHLDVAANLRFGLRRCAGRPGELAFDAVVDALDLAPLLGRRTPALSGGEVQRVAIGRALLSQPRLLVLDEPLSALDRPRRREILPFLDRVRRLLHAPLLYVTHDPEEALRLGDRMIVMEGGEVCAEGDPRRLLAGLGVPSAGGGTALRLSGQVLGPGPSEGLVRVAAGGGIVLARTPAGSGPGPARAGRAVVLLVPLEGMVLFSARPPVGSLANLIEVRLLDRTAGAGGVRLALGDTAFALPWPPGAQDLPDPAEGGTVVLGFPAPPLAAGSA